MKDLALPDSLDVPKGWERAPLGKVCKLICRGIAPSYTEHRGVPVVNQKCIRGHRIDFSLARKNDETKKRVPHDRRIQAGDVLVNSTGTGTLGRVAQVRNAPDADTTVDTHVTIVRPDPERFYPEFFGYALVAIEDALKLGGQGAVGQTELPRTNIAEKFFVSFPSCREEQKRIVAVLDRGFAAFDRARALAEANLADAAELLENGVNEVFTGLAANAPIKSLSDAVHPDCKLSYGIVQPGDEVGGGLPVVRPVDLKQRVVSQDGLKRISPDRADGYSRTKLVGGEILLCVRGSTGELSVASAELAGANVTRGIVPIRFPMKSVLPEFAYFQLRSRYAQDQIAAGTYGAALMQINIKDLRNLSFISPELEVQREAILRVEHLYEQTERLRDAFNEKLTDVRDLRQSLLHRAFSGQLI